MDTADVRHHSPSSHITDVRSIMHSSFMLHKQQQLCMFTGWIVQEDMHAVQTVACTHTRRSHDQSRQSTLCCERRIHSSTAYADRGRMWRLWHSSISAEGRRIFERLQHRGMYPTHHCPWVGRSSCSNITLHGYSPPCLVTYCRATCTSSTTQKVSHTNNLLSGDHATGY